ncbi:hypothetical protein BAY60_18200 [Prauserella muralis]|uniref:PspA-associated domain-containing protein n=1 Tax=Prauserella muralis TaxID=588067 RepID=A0A2V4B2Q2_9PSEU|nr:hypothetical protein BAY60_18200 [Prauserella muralis]TWE27421.1 hypothetical protein FHX69_0044 [Prauserella muralis]
MIIRILGEGQYEVDDSRVDELNVLDTQLQEAVEEGDADLLGPVLAALLTAVRERGAPVAAEVLVPSELVLPAPDASLSEIRAMLSDDGLIPG